MALAVRFAFLVSTLFIISQKQVTHYLSDSEKSITKTRRVLSGSPLTRHLLTFVRRKPQLMAYVPLSKSVLSPYLSHV